MLRRFAAMLLVGASLLGPASAALACATGAQGDCCPEGSSVPCSDGELDFQASTPAICCVAAPAQSRIATVDSPRSARDGDQNSGAADLAVVAPWSTLQQETVPRPAHRHPPASAGSTDASHTYLLTGRLRL